jgi:hypothetical protein
MVDMTGEAGRGPMMIDLALQGGGSHGAFNWGVLDRILETDWVGIEGISGTSAGAMNAAPSWSARAQNGICPTPDIDRFIELDRGEGQGPPQGHHCRARLRALGPVAQVIRIASLSTDSM